MNVLKYYLNIKTKINFKYFLVFIITLCTPINKIYSQVGCMDSSKHTNLKLGYDYKVPYFVKCACPCKTYEILARHGNKCSKCLHYRAPVETIIVTKNLVNRKRY